jgi:hypothetical protein
MGGAFPDVEGLVYAPNRETAGIIPVSADKSLGIHGPARPGPATKVAATKYTKRVTTKNTKCTKHRKITKTPKAIRNRRSAPMDADDWDRGMPMD